MQQNYGQAPMPPRPPHYWKPKNGFGTTGLVLGVAGVVCLFSEYAGNALLAGIVGIIFGILGIGRARSHEATNLGSAIAGTACSAVAALFALVHLSS